jgi:hypothetical protein
MKLLILIAIFFTSFESLIFAEKIPLGGMIEKINNLEKEKRWNEALEVYREIDKLFLSSMTKKLMYRKGLCEIQCSEFRAAEESFAWVLDGVEIESVDAAQKDFIISSMFNLAFAQARLGKLDESKESLIFANKNFERLGNFTNNQSWISWRSRNDARVRAVISTFELQEEKLQDEKK